MHTKVELPCLSKACLGDFGLNYLFNLASGGGVGGFSFFWTTLYPRVKSMLLNFRLLFEKCLLGPHLSCIRPEISDCRVKECPCRIWRCRFSWFFMGTSCFSLWLSKSTSTAKNWPLGNINLCEM
jgi:hypothetical protein